jgi:hypothetical protein
MIARSVLSRADEFHLETCKAIAYCQPCLGLYPALLVFRVISFPLEHYGTSPARRVKENSPKKQEMARRLPWATDADSAGDAKPKRTPVQRARYEPRVSSDDDLTTTANPHQSSSTVNTSSQAPLRKRETCKNGFCCAFNVLTRLL